MSKMVVSEFDGRALVTESLKWQATGILLMICHVCLVKLSLAFYPVVMILIGWLYVRASLAAILVFFQILIYQNLIISIFDADMDFTTFQALQGTNFVVLMVMGGMAALRLLPRRKQHQAIFISVAVALLFASVYTVLGLAKAGVSPAMVYFRFFTGAIFAGIIGLDVGRAWSFRTIGRCFLYSAVLSLLLSVVEYCYATDYYGVINAVRFYQLKYWAAPQGNTFYTPQDIINQFTAVFFNISGSTHGEYGFDNFRFGGTIMNPISNAYIVGVLAITAIALKRSIWLAVLLPMLVLAGTKGPIFLIVLSIALYWIWTTVRSRFLLLLAGLGLTAFYVGAGIIIGLHSGDFHVLGFMGGLRSLLHTPIGHGMGVGGNLSEKMANFRMDNETAAFKSGQLDFAIESAVGVLFYQMGIASAAVLGVFVTFLWKAPLGLTKMFALPQRSDVMFFAVAMIVVNGIFQEEAYAPYASGLLMLLAGVLFGNQRQVGQILAPTAQMRFPPGHRIMAGATLCLLLLWGGHAQAVPLDRLQTLERGANISSDFEYKGDLGGEIKQLAAIGFGHVRVFVLVESLDDPAYLQQIDRLVAETASRQVGLILCMTSKTHLWTDQTDQRGTWLAAWMKLADHLRASSPRYVFLELANEPEISDSERWDRVQSRLRQAVRKILPQHTILLTGSPTSMVWSLVEHPTDAGQDSNIIYCFHLYQPMAVTCQGCDCCPEYRALSGLDYPPNEANIRQLTNPATAEVLEAYRQKGAIVMRREVDAAAAWSSAHHVPVLATEFGVFGAASEKTRAAWLREARSRLEAARIGWTVWEWKGGFGVAPLLPHTPLAQALGLGS